MSLLDILISQIAPHECLGCRAEGRLICIDCAGLLSPIPERCYRCHAYSPGSVTCQKCRRQSALRQVRVVSVYAGVAKAAVYKLKFDGARSLAKEMGRMLPRAMDEPLLIIPVPTATGRVRARGYDQAVLIGREYALINKQRFSKCLRREGQTRQMGSSRSIRSKQLVGAFRVVDSRAVDGAHIVLVDDVLTTGSTLEAAARILRQAGARRVDAVVFAQA